MPNTHRISIPGVSDTHEKFYFTQTFYIMRVIVSPKETKHETLNTLLHQFLSGALTVSAIIYLFIVTWVGFKHTQSCLSLDFIQPNNRFDPHNNIV